MASTFFQIIKHFVEIPTHDLIFIQSPTNVPKEIPRQVPLVDLWEVVKIGKSNLVYILHFSKDIHRI